MFLRSIHRKKDGKDHRYFSIDVWIPTVDQRWLILPRYTQPSPDTKLLIEKLKLHLPSQPPPRLGGAKTEPRNRSTDGPVGGVCGEDLSLTSTDSKALNPLRDAQLRKFG
jgi:hypothetical protein